MNQKDTNEGATAPIDDGGQVLSWLRSALRESRRRKGNAARRKDHIAADDAQTDEEALKHVIAMLARRAKP